MSAEEKDAMISSSPGLNTSQSGVNGRGNESLSTSGDLTEQACSKKSPRVMIKTIPGLIPAYLLAPSDLVAMNSRDSSSSSSDANISRPEASGPPGNPSVEGCKQQPRSLPKTAWSGKEKTPMCLVNELSRFNKIDCDYTLTDEQGPAHKKVFYVTLKIGSETYRATGHSIKKAQHNAASLALAGTAYRCPSLPIDKGLASIASSSSSHQQQLPVTSASAVVSELKTTVPNKSVLTPTVELNALAARLGQQPLYYQLDSPYVHLRPTLPAAGDLFQGFRYAPQHPPQPLFAVPNMDYLGPFSSQFPGLLQHHLALSSQPPAVSHPKKFCMAVRLGDREFVAEGATRQLARHNVAAKALTALRASMPVLSFVPANPGAAPSSARTDAGDAVCVAADGSSSSSSASSRRYSAGSGAAVTDTGRASSASPYYQHHHKSEINALHELARRLCLTLSFDVGGEVGPPHQRHFLTRCSCGDFVSEGSGNSKRSSKKDAARRMLQRLGAACCPASAVLSASSPAPTLSDAVPQSGRGFSNRSRTRSLMKVHKLSANYGSMGINPITRLAQIQQAKEQAEPVYQLLPALITADVSVKNNNSDTHVAGRKHFTVKVTIGDKETTGSGPNKRIAKRNAAESMLALIGCSRPQSAIAAAASAAASAATPAATPAPVKSLLKPTTLSSPTGDTCSENSQQQTHHSGGSEKRVTFLDDCNSGGSAAAGGHGTSAAFPSNFTQVSSDVGSSVPRIQSCSSAVLSKMAKELLDSGSSRMARALLANSGASFAPSSTADTALSAAESSRRLRPKDQLEYLAQAASIALDFVDVPQGTSKEGFLALVTIIKQPPVTSHGTGATVDEAYDAAALAALQQLAAGAAAKHPNSPAGTESPVGSCNRPIILRRPTATDPPGQKHAAEQAPERNLLVEHAIKVEQ